MLDKLPAWARHLLIVAGAVFGGTIAESIVTGGGITALDWGVVLTKAIDTAAVAAATAAAALWLTPLTRQYGVGSAADGE